MSRKLNKLSAFFLSLVSLSVVAQGQDVDYTCDPRKDYGVDEFCPKNNIGNGKCDNPNHGGDGGEECLQQDCIDCNYLCRAFDADCFGCLNAKGCYYCPGDATCQNSDLYQSETKLLSCTKTNQFWLGGKDDPDELCISSDSITTDPLSLTNNWLYEMINVKNVWENLKYTGKGVKIRINDDGVDVDNTDFEGRFDQANSCPNFRPSGNADDVHGTKVAGIVAGVANNQHCAAGIAYESTFSSCNVFGGSNAISSLTFKIESFDISQNSFGQEACAVDRRARSLQDNACPFTVPAGAFYNPCDPKKCDFSKRLTTPCEDSIYRHCKDNYRDDPSCEDFIDVIIGDNTCNFGKMPLSFITQLAKGVTEGRDGKGAIYVFASGNDFWQGSDVNMSGYVNNRYTISVGSVGKDGLHSDFSNPGAALTVTAPVGDYKDVSYIMTTGLGGTCTDSGPGTSFSAPVVSGVIALMLEARPELSWRDVQGILAVSSQKKNDPKDKTAKTNAAGIWHSNWYGFGIIDATKAVNTALSWNLFTPEYQAIGESAEENKAISNNGIEYTSELTISADYAGFSAESATVLLNLRHYNRGDLELTLTSPRGTQSILLPGKRPENQQPEGDERWKLTTLRNWGEDPTGTWKLKIKDRVTDNTPNLGENELRQWKLVVYGQTADGNPPVITTEAPTVTTETPSFAPTVKEIDEESNGSTEDGEESNVPTEEVVTSPTEDPSQGATNAPGDGPTLDATIDEDFTVVPTNVPTTAPVAPTDAPTTAPVAPTNAPTPRPTAVPTYKPGVFTFPPIKSYIRPTHIIKDKNGNTLRGKRLTPRTPIRNSAGTRQSSAEAAITRQSATDTASRSAPGSSIQLQTLEAEEREGKASKEYVSTELVKNLSLVLEGVSEVPETSWLIIQDALEKHTTSVVTSAMPGLHFRSEVRLVSVKANEIVPIHMRRDLKPENEGRPSVTIVYDELMQFDHLSGTESLEATTLAGLGFADFHSRENFVKNIHKKFDGVEPNLESLISVSSLEVPSALTEDRDYVLSSSTNGSDTAGSVNDQISNGPSNATTWAAISFGVCVTLLLVWQSKK